jgi:glycosyltransferase involved in cell wall biosynthesis
VTRILIALDSFSVGGTELHALKSIRALKRAGYDVAVIVARPVGSLEADFRAEVPVFSYSLRSLASISAISAVTEIVSILRTYRPDIVHALDKYSNVLVVPAARLCGVKRVIASKRWFTYVPGYYRQLNALAFRFAHAVVANSRAVASSLETSERVPNRKIFLLNNILVDEMFDRPPTEWIAARREEFGIASFSRVVGMIARLEQVKDHDTFLRAFALVAARRSDVVAVVVGTGSRESALKRAADSLGIGHAVRFVGYRANIPNLNWMFDVSVLTSRSEGSPNSIFEAMAAGCPVVTTEVGGTVGAAGYGVPVSYCPVGDEACIADSIVASLASDGETLQAREARQGRVRQAFSVDAFIARSNELFGPTFATHAQGTGARA